MKVSKLGLSTRVTNLLISAGIKTLADLAQKAESDLAEIPGLGPKALEEIQECLAQHSSSEDEAPADLVPEEIAEPEADVVSNDDSQQPQADPELAPATGPTTEFDMAAGGNAEGVADWSSADAAAPVPVVSNDAEAVIDTTPAEAQVNSPAPAATQSRSTEQSDDDTEEEEDDDIPDDTGRQPRQWPQWQIAAGLGCAAASVIAMALIVATVLWANWPGGSEKPSDSSGKKADAGVTDMPTSIPAGTAKIEEYMPGTAGPIQIDEVDSDGLVIKRVRSPLYTTEQNRQALTNQLNQPTGFRTPKGAASRGMVNIPMKKPSEAEGIPSAEEPEE